MFPSSKSIHTSLVLRGSDGHLMGIYAHNESLNIPIQKGRITQIQYRVVFAIFSRVKLNCWILVAAQMALYISIFIYKLYHVIYVRIKHNLLYQQLRHVSKYSQYVAYKKNNCLFIHLLSFSVLLWWTGTVPHGNALRITDDPSMKKSIPGHSGTFRLRFFRRCYPLVNIQKTIENGHRNSEFSH